MISVPLPKHTNIGTHTHTQLRWSYGKVLLWPGPTFCWLSLIWMVTQRFGMCVRVYVCVCVSLGPRPTATTFTILMWNHQTAPSLPLPCGFQHGRAQCGNCREREHMLMCPPTHTHTHTTQTVQGPLQGQPSNLQDRNVLFLVRKETCRQLGERKQRRGKNQGVQVYSHLGQTQFCIFPTQYHHLYTSAVGNTVSKCSNFTYLLIRLCVY